MILSLAALKRKLYGLGPRAFNSAALPFPRAQGSGLKASIVDPEGALYFLLANWGTAMIIPARGFRRFQESLALPFCNVNHIVCVINRPLERFGPTLSRRNAM